MFALDNLDMTNEWIDRRLNELGKSKGDLAKALGLPNPRITEIIQGRRLVALKELPPLARFLEMDGGDLVLALTGEQIPVSAKGIQQIVVRGAVQAGHWVEAAEFHQDDCYTVPVPDDPRYPGIKRFGLEVRGPSMNRVYPEGTILVCVHRNDWHKEPASGQRVVVERRKPDGLVEATVKELREDSGKQWLWPNSTHPEHQTPIPLDDGQTDTVEIVAVVTGSYKPE